MNSLSSPGRPLSAVVRPGSSIVIGAIGLGGVFMAWALVAGIVTD